MIKKWGGAFIVLVLAMGACSRGVQEVREAMTNKAPQNLSCQEATSQLPTDRWIHLTGAVGALGESAIRTENGRVDRVYVPLRCDGSSPSEPISLVLSTENASVIRAAQARQEMVIGQDVAGMVRSAKDHDTGTTTGGGLGGGGCANCDVKIAGLAPGYVVIEDGVAPSLVRGLAWLVGAVVGCGFIVKLVRS